MSRLCSDNHNSCINNINSKYKIKITKYKPVDKLYNITLTNQVKEVVYLYKTIPSLLLTKRKRILKIQSIKVLKNVLHSFDEISPL